MADQSATMGSLFQELESACLDESAVRAAAPQHGGPQHRPPPSAPGPVATTQSSASPQRSHTWEYCEDCGVPTVGSPRSMSELICPDCGALFERPYEEDMVGDDAVARNPGIRQTPRLRMVGPDHSRLQKQLDKSAQVDAEASKISELYRELMNYNNEYIRKYGRSFSQDAGTILRDIAIIYVRQVASKSEVMRAQKKRAVIGILLDSYCKKTQKAVPRNVILNLMQLPNGLARGESQLRAIDACRDMLNCDKDKAWVESSWSNLGFEYKPFELHDDIFLEGSEDRINFQESDKKLILMLREATYELIKDGKEKHIGIGISKFIPQTRGVATTYVVLRRAALAGLLPDYWKIPREVVSGERGSIEWVAAICKIRPQTMRGYINKLFRFHSKFEALYTKYGLCSDRIETL